MQKVKTFETSNNTYYITYGKTAKTTYEQQQEQREEFIYMLAQKSIALLLIIICCILAYITKEGLAAIFSLIIGIPLLLTKEHAFIL